MTSLAASTDFRRSNHERSHSESSVWIDDYLNIGLNTDELLDTQLRDDELNLLVPFEDGEDLQSALSHFIPECAFSEFDGVEPVDIETVDAEELFQNTNLCDSSAALPPTETEKPQGAYPDNQIPSQNVPCDPVHSDQSGFAQPSLPLARCNKTPSPKKAFVVDSPNKWLGAHPVSKEVRKPSSKSKSKSKSSTFDKNEEVRLEKVKVRPDKDEVRHGKSEARPEGEKTRAEKDRTRPEKDRTRHEENKCHPGENRSRPETDKVRLEGVLVTPHHQKSSGSKNQKIVSQALLDRLKAASKRAARQSILISAPVTQQPAKRCHVSLDHDYCGDLTKGERDDFEVQPMELEPEHERGVGRIEVLPDLSLAAREVNPNQNLEVVREEVIDSEELDGHRIVDVRNAKAFEECSNVISEEVVTSLDIGSASSDSGIESCVRTEEYDSEEGSRRQWKDERPRASRRSSPSSSDGSGVSSHGSRRSTNRGKRRRSSSRRRDSRSRSPSPRRSFSSKRRRTYSRDSSPESNSGSEGRRFSTVGGRSSSKPVRRERKNIWAMTEKPRSFPTMPPLNKPGQKTVMQSALEEIERGGDRQVLYVGQIQEGTTRSYIREKFDRFGPIAEVSLHFRETGENYAFVTFHQPKDAYFALDNAALLPDFKLCFGGRRQFCGRKWSDLDNERERADLNSGSKDLDRKRDDFDSLLNEIRTASKRK